MVPPFTMQAPHGLGVSPNLEEKSWGVESVVLSSLLRVNVEDVCNIFEAKLTTFFLCVVDNYSFQRSMCSLSQLEKCKEQERSFLILPLKYGSSLFFSGLFF